MSARFSARIQHAIVTGRCCEIGALEVLAMGLRSTERLKLRRIEEDLRADDPGLDALLAGRPPRRGPSLHPPAAGVLAGYIVPPALVLAGLVLDVTWLVVAGVAVCPFVPVIAWPKIRRHFVRGWTRRSREP
jgi:hypothetical protein